MHLQLVVVVADQQDHLAARTQTRDQLRQDARSSGERVLERPWRSSMTSPSRTRRSAWAIASGRALDERRVVERGASAGPHRCAGRRRRACALRRRWPASAWRIVLGSMKRTSSWTTSSSCTSSVPRSRKNCDEALDELLGGAGAGGDADDAHAVEPLLADLRTRCRSGGRRRRARARPRPAGSSSRSCGCRSRAPDRTPWRAA